MVLHYFPRLIALVSIQTAFQRVVQVFLNAREFIARCEIREKKRNFGTSRLSVFSLVDVGERERERFRRGVYDARRANALLDIDTRARAVKSRRKLRYVPLCKRSRSLIVTGGPVWISPAFAEDPFASGGQHMGESDYDMKATRWRNA